MKSKFIGYCDCDCMITTTDVFSSNVYLCPSCGCKGNMKKINKDHSNKKEFASKKDYLDTEINFDIKHSSPKEIEEKPEIEAAEITEETKDDANGEDLRVKDVNDYLKTEDEE